MDRLCFFLRAERNCNSGDEARVARAGGSGRGASCITLAHGTPLPRAPAPRAAAAAGWPVPAPTHASSPGTPAPAPAPVPAATTPHRRSPPAPERPWASTHQPQHQQRGPPPAAQDAHPQPQSQLSQQLPATALRELAPATVAAPMPPPRPPEAVSLRVPRPDAERLANEYVEAPFGTGPIIVPVCPKLQQQPPRRSHQSPPSGDGGARPVTKQPVSFTKEPTIPGGGGRVLGGGLSIMCERCGRCRCESCREPPPLPSRWLCDNSCFCSAETALDYASCLCCVKGLFYHCADGGLGPGGPPAPDPGADCADDPCSCSGSRKAARWTCLGALALVLPCLLCYWPLRACVAGCEACYARGAAQGCRCEQRVHLPEALARDSRYSRDPEKRLLEPTRPEL